MSDKPRRSRAWFGAEGSHGFIPRSWMKSQGHPSHMFDGRPVIGIANTFSDLTPCNGHLRQLAEFVKRGVYEAGGFPLEFPVFSPGESNLRPTTMLFRNLASMDAECAIRGNPMDGVVLLAGCDKTTPSLLMGAASVDLPTILLSGGPMLNAWDGRKRMGSGTFVSQSVQKLQAGTMTQAQFDAAEAALSRSAGSCMTMGTASTMASLVEGMGLALPDNAALPAVDARRQALAHLTGMRAVELVKQDIRMSRFLTRRHFENAILLNGALGGSTNAVVHLLALAGRAGVELSLDDWDRLGRDMPCLVDLMPSGQFLMEDFCYAGGVPAVLKALLPRLHGGTETVAGRSLAELCEEAPEPDGEVIRPLHDPFKPQGGIAVLRGNLAPQGAIIKPSAASPALMRHTGPAVTFEDIEDFNARIDDPDLPVTADSVLVLKNCGPRGYPGMPEVGNTRLPAKLARQGVTDMVRLSDARMSGTAYGTVVLHIAPESAAGGPLGLVETGDLITLDVEARKLELHVDEATLAARRAARPPFASPYARGYEKLYVEHVLGAERGVDFDFLVGRTEDRPLRGSH
ncbi:dihydroxy-acid dehydratase [Roseomonas sp. OT10]|uniref:IlvD/Edd family dehydratase n=1 Tax=Roseomonas cutis TaxID=2897332 RepID=UPI001E49AD6B|nr:IlvD/Edd family dehydratase [Roseomonas sp. OT10]UFN47715.1 dihydroxy-acid dehydratase [Roseomonas sp. OT10]